MSTSIATTCLRRLLTFPSAFALLAASAPAATWTVDDDGGSGVDFTNLSVAVATVAPGDVLLVAPGVYGAVVVDRGLTIVGSAGVELASLTVSGLPAGPRFAFSGFRAIALSVTSCAAPTLFTNFVITGTVGLHDCADVRLRQATIGPVTAPATTMVVDHTRLELTHADVRGGNGPTGTPYCSSATDGGTALVLTNLSTVHVSLSSLRGGNGGWLNEWNEWCSPWAGDGASAVRVETSSALLVTGTPANLLRGGDAGWDLLGGTYLGFHDGVPASAVVNAGGSVQVSSVTITGGLYTYGGSATGVSGPHTVADPRDPSLRLANAVLPGSPVVFTVYGAAGDAVRLRLGRQLTVQDLPDVLEDRLLLPLRTYDLGTMPASGESQFTFTIPSALPHGFLIVAQASATSGASTRLTQSVPLILP